MIDEERRPAGVPEARAAVSMMDVLRHVEPRIVQVPEARRRNLTVSGEHEVLVESISDVDEGRALEITGCGKAVEIAHGRGHAEGDALHRLFEDDHAEVVRIRCGAPVVIGVAVVSAHREAHRALCERVRREADPEPTRGECGRRERVGAVARGQEDACRDERAGTELTHASVQMNDEDRPDVRVGRVDVPPGDGGSRRPQRHKPNYRENPKDLEDTPTHEPHRHHRDPRSGWSANTISFGRTILGAVTRTSSGPAPATGRATGGSPSRDRLTSGKLPGACT